jgi:outer membrane biosynthesis protein TonB
MRLLLLACALSLFASGVPAQVPYHIEDPARWGTLSRVVPPELPRSALAARQPATVDIEGIVTGHGMLQDPAYKAHSPEAAALVAALKDVVSHWRLYPIIGTDCEPRPEHVTTRVGVTFDGDDPKFTFEYVRERPMAPKSQEMAVLEKARLRYPPAMQRAGIEGNVFALMDVDSAGNVVAVKSKVFAHLRDVPIAESDRAYARIQRDFRTAAEDPLARWKFSPAGEGDPAHRQTCMDVYFRFGE